MKKRMIFPLMLLCAPAVLQAMEVAMQSDFWQLNPESLSSMEERFVSAS